MLVNSAAAAGNKIELELSTVHAIYCVFVPGDKFIEVNRTALTVQCIVQRIFCSWQ